MKLNVFQSSSGDCLLLSSDDDHHILVDGAFAGNYQRNVRDNLEGIVGDSLDLVCISHIDSDHISGILKMLDEEVAWRVFEHQISNGLNPSEPDFKRPPKINKIWYNGFKDIVDDTRPVEDTLLFNARAFGFGAADLELAADMNFLANGVKQGLQLQHRLSPSQLKIPLNPERDGKPLLVESSGERIPLGDSMQLTLLGPFKKDLEALKVDWNTWLKKNKDVVLDVQKKAKEDQELLGLSDAEMAKHLLSNYALSQSRGSVTAPNLASIVFLAEEGEQKILMTGDARDNEIIEGLEHSGHLTPTSNIHVDILKMPHHGSINNINEEFCKRIIANHYVFCGGSGGNHKNPDEKVLEFILDSRIGNGVNKSTHEKVDDAFTLWFSANTNDGGNSANKHMQDVFDFIQPKADNSGGRFKVNIMGDGKDRLVVPVPAGGQP